jgi:hypothetical protein
MNYKLQLNPTVSCQLTSRSDAVVVLAELVPREKLEDTCERMDSLKIRPAASGDAATLGRLLEQLGYPTNAAHIHTGVRLTKIFVNRSGAAPGGEGRSSRKGGAKDARNRSRG